MQEKIKKLAKSPVMSSYEDMSNFINIMEFPKEYNEILKLTKEIIKKYYLGEQMTDYYKSIINISLQVVSGNLPNNMKIVEEESPLIIQKLEKKLTKEEFLNIIKWADKNNIDENVLPREFDLLNSVIELKLSALNLFEILPELFSLPNLTELWLGYNNLTSIPRTIGNLKRLKKLSLSKNNISTLPIEIIQLNNLELLAIDGNLLKLSEKQNNWIDKLKLKDCLVVMDNSMSLTNEKKDNEKTKILDNDLENKEDNLCKVIYDGGNEGLGVTAMDFLSKKGLIVAYVGRNTILILEKNTGKINKEIQEAEYIRSIKFSPDGRYVTWAGKSLKTANTNGEIIREQRLHRDDNKISIDISSSGKYYIAVGNDGLLLEEFLGEFIFESYNDHFSSVVFSPNEKNVLLGNKYGDILVFDITKPDILKLFYSEYVVELMNMRLESILLKDSEDIYFEGHKAPVTCMIFSPDKEMLLSGDKNGDMILWEYKSKKILYTIKGENASVSSLSFSSNGKYFISGYDEGEYFGGDNHQQIKLWNVENGSFISTVGEHKASISNVFFDGDTLIISSGTDGKICEWNIESFLIYN